LPQAQRSRRSTRGAVMVALSLAAASRSRRCSRPSWAVNRTLARGGRSANRRSGARSRRACATPLAAAATPDSKAVRQAPGRSKRSPSVAAIRAALLSWWVSRNSIFRCRAASTMSRLPAVPGTP
jgi:hypothetical protein